MNWLDRWLLKRIARKLVVQGYDHHMRIAEYYKIMEDAARNEFTEDNEPTLKAFLTDCFNQREDTGSKLWKSSYNDFMSKYILKKK